MCQTSAGEGTACPKPPEQGNTFLQILGTATSICCSVEYKWGSGEQGQYQGTHGGGESEDCDGAKVEGSGYQS